MRSINRTAVDAQLEGVLSTRKLRIASNWKMFKELISGIYSDKTYAIARETLANAIDSHVAAGSTASPVIHVPSAMEPYFSIRDFGTAMTEELMETVYCTLGESTKDDPNSDESDKYVGKFGLGSKSPFAYTDSFQVTSYYDGIAHIYDVFEGREGPELAHLANEPSDEPRGVLITFGVASKDVADFRRAIQRAAEGSPIPPIFEGAADFSIPKRTIVSEGKGWKLLDSTFSGIAEAHQGTVLYPLNSQPVLDCPPELFPLFKQPFRFEFPIGSLDIITSREALSYDAETSANIVARLTEVQADIMQMIAEELKGAKTYSQFCCAFAEARRRYPENQFGKMIANGPTFKGRSPKSLLTIKTENKRIRSDGNEIDPITSAPKKVYSISHRMGSFRYSFNPMSASATVFREARENPSGEIKVDPTHKLIIVLEDTTQRNRYPTSRMGTFYSERARRYDTNVLWVRHTGDYEYGLKRIYVAMGRPEVEIVNLLAIPHNLPPRLASQGRRVPCRQLNLAQKYWDSVMDIEELPDEAYLVPMRNGDVDVGADAFSTDVILEYYQTLVAYGMDDLPIYGVPASSTKKMAQFYPDWINLRQAMEAALPGAFDEKVFHAAHLRSFSLSGHNMISFAKTLRNTATPSHYRTVAQSTEFGQLDRILARFEGSNGNAVREEEYPTMRALHALYDRVESRRVSMLQGQVRLNVHTEYEYEQSLEAGATYDPTVIDKNFKDAWAALVEKHPETYTNYATALAARVQRDYKAITEEAVAIAEDIEENYPLLPYAHRHQRMTKELCDELLTYVFNKAMLDHQRPSTVKRKGLLTASA
jgi:hypothetical protein